MPVLIRSRWATLVRCLFAVSLVGIAPAALAGSQPLQIEGGDSALPTAIVGSPYLQSLQAQGGVPPYTWTGTVPAALDLTLSPEGVLSGTPEQATSAPLQLTVTVIDSVGSQAQAMLTMEVIAVDDLAITTPFLQPAVFGTQYDQSILGSDGTVTNPVLSWSLPDGDSLPAGVQFAESGTPAVAQLSGIPTQAGIFPLTVNLSDNFGHTATRQYIFTVTDVGGAPPRSLPTATIGEPYSTQLNATSNSPLSWSLNSGALPPGLSLSTTGEISGTVSASAVPGTYPFAVALTAGGPESLVPLEIEVQAAPPRPPSQGCATGNGLSGAGLLLLAMAWLKVSRRRNRSTE